MVVIDCNVLVAMLHKTQEGIAMQSFLVGENRIVSVDSIKVELANALSKYAKSGQISIDEAVVMHEKGLGLIDQFVPMDELAREAIAESVRLNHSAYDMFYFVLARRNAATLFTLDKKLQDICLANGVNCIYSIREKIFPTECEDTQCDRGR